MNLNEAHIHLILNHIPIVGCMFVTTLLIVAIALGSSLMQRVALVFLVLVALSTAATYLTGDGAADIVFHSLPNISGESIKQHEDIARISLVLMFVIGVVTLGGLLLFRKRERLPMAFISTVLILALVACGVFVFVGYLGGLITHPEIQGLIAPLTATRLL